MFQDTDLKYLGYQFSNFDAQVKDKQIQINTYYKPLESGPVPDPLTGANYSGIDPFDYNAYYQKLKNGGGLSSFDKKTQDMIKTNANKVASDIWDAIDIGYELLPFPGYQSPGSQYRS